jgi:hypothetical protein
MRIRARYADVTATLALVFALGGTAYAGVTLGRGAVRERNIATGAVTSSKVRDHSLLAVDFAAGQLPAGPTAANGSSGAAGPAGPAGPHGPAGTARAYATVTAAGVVVAARSKNVAAVTKPAAAPIGTYCLTLAAGVDPATTSPVANADNADVATSSKDFAQVDTAGPDCGGRLEVITRHLTVDTTTTPVSIASHRSDEGFTVLLG